MSVLNFVGSNKFLIPSKRLDGDLFLATRDFERAIFLQDGQEDEDIFHATFPNGSTCLGNMSDFVSNLFSMVIRLAQTTDNKSWTDWMTEFRNVHIRNYDESNREVVAIIYERIPDLIEFHDHEVFVRQLLGDLCGYVRLIAWLEQIGYSIPPYLNLLWSIWEDGYWPCGFQGNWPGKGSYVVFEPS